MLETTALFLGHTDRSVRPIVAANGVILGSARWPDVRKRCFWSARTVLEVREADDEPLLFTIRRRWGLWAHYEIRDADGVHVGSVAGALVYDAHGALLAQLHTRKGTPDGRWETAEGGLLAEVGADTDNVRIQFTDTPDRNPFVRMLLLASMLILNR